jgi:hypothetical protein
MTATTPQYLNAKGTAALLRRVLRATFPATKFTVHTSRGAGTSSVSIGWTDGPSVARVNELTRQFQAGNFDGMTDMYDYDPARVVEVDGVLYRPNCRYVFTSRECSPRLFLRALQAVAGYWHLTADEHARLEQTENALVTGYADMRAAEATLDRLWIASAHRYALELVRIAMEDRTTATRCATVEASR